jgi:hypothetical protein
MTPLGFTMARVKRIQGANFYKEQIGQWNYWRVRVGKKLTGGKPIIRRFAVYAKAVEWVEGLIEEREKHGSELFSLTHDQLSEARAAFERLAEYQVSLAAVVDHWIKFQAPLEVQKTFSELEKEFVTSRKNIGCKEKTLSQYRSYMKVISEEFGSTIAARTLQADVEDWLSESDWAPRTRKNYLVTLMTFFGWARDRGYIVWSPAWNSFRDPGVQAFAEGHSTRFGTSSVGCSSAVRWTAAIRSLRFGLERGGHQREAS